MGGYHGVPPGGSQGQNGEKRPKIESCPKPPKVGASKLWVAKTGRKRSIFAILTHPTLLYPLTGAHPDGQISRAPAPKWAKSTKIDQNRPKSQVLTKSPWVCASKLRDYNEVSRLVESWPTRALKPVKRLSRLSQQYAAPIPQIG